jgi:uncharacterized protein
MGNLETVQELYGAVGRGDVGAILDRLADDVRWDEWSATSRVAEAVPYVAPRVGREAVGEFFGQVAEALEFERFEPTNLLAGGDQIAAVITVALIAKASGKRIEDTEIHLWTFGEDGRITALRHFVDTLQHAEAQGS